MLEIGLRIEFSEEGKALCRYLGAYYRFDVVSDKHPAAPRNMHVNIEGYLLQLVARFQEVYTGPLHKVGSSYLSEKEMAEVSEEPRDFAKLASSYVASGRFASLVARPDRRLPVGQSWTTSS